MLPPSFTPELLRRLELLKVRSRRAFLGSRQGGHLSPKRGHGIEFADYRRYELGDNPRHIDWGVYARSERLYIRTFQEEQDLSVLIILDSSSSMRVPEGSGKWERARDVALALAYIALMEQDSVRIAIPGLWVSPKCSGVSAIHHLSEAFSKIEFKESSDFKRDFQQTLSSIRFPGVAIFISDLLLEFRELEYLFSALRARNLDLTTIQLLSSQDEVMDGVAGDVLAIDSETGEKLELSIDTEQLAHYKYLIGQHNDKVRSFLVGCGVKFIKSNCADDFGKFLLEQLPRVGLLK